MATGNKVIRCLRCGSPIQCEDKKKEGYVSPEIYAERNNLTAIYCESCYKDIADFNKVADTKKIDQHILTLLDDAVKSNALILWTVDLYTFNGILPKQIAEKLKNNKIIVIGTKKDLFPKPIREKALHNFLKYSFGQYGIDPLDIIIINAKNKIETINTVNRVKEQYSIVNTLDMYLIGEYRSGKSTLITTFLKDFKNNSDRTIEHITHKSGIRYLKMPISNRRTFFEVPSYSNSNSILSKVEKDVQKYLIPRNALKVIYAVLHEGDVATIGSLAAFIIKKGINTSYKYYCAEGIETQKTTYSKGFQSIKTNMISKSRRPVSMNIQNFSDFDLFEFNISNDGKLHEISVQDLGFITFKGKGQIIWVLIPKGITVNEGIGRY